jgi:hypothetical protein
MKYELAIAIWEEDYGVLSEAIARCEEPDTNTIVSTPDEDYRVIDWELVDVDDPEFRELLATLSMYRHAVMGVPGDSEAPFICDFEISDDRGTDEEFDYILSYRADVVLWGDVDQPVSRYKENSEIKELKDEVKYLKDILSAYVENDYQASCDPEYVKQALCDAGMSEEDFEKYGFGWLTK